MDIERFLKKARNSISKFCYKECNSYCCRKGYLVINENQVNLVTQKRKKELELSKVLTKMKGEEYSLYLGDYLHPCPSLKDLKCSIHRKNNRPLVCKEFPIGIKGNVIFLSTRCLAVKTGLFYPYIERLRALGYRTIESDQFYDSDFQNIIYPKTQMPSEMPSEKQSPVVKVIQKAIAKLPV